MVVIERSTPILAFPLQGERDMIFYYFTHALKANHSLYRGVSETFFFKAEDGIRDIGVTGVQTCALPICNDSQGASPDGVLGQEHPHPRAYGTFPHILRKYVHDEKKLTLEDAIRKFSALPAQRMRLADRGVLKTGMWADIVVFDPETIRDLATFDAPNQLSQGMRFVLVNGVPVIEEGKTTNALPGKVLGRR